MGQRVTAPEAVQVKMGLQWVLQPIKIGAVEVPNRVVRTASRSLPRHSGNRTFTVPVGMSQGGQEQPLAHILQAKFVQRVVSSRMPAL